MLYYRSLPNLKQKYACIISQLLKVEQKSGSGLARRFWVFHVVVIKITAGLHSSEGSQDSFSHMADRHLWLRQRPQYLAMGLLECPYNMAAGFPENRCSEREVGKCCGVFYDLEERSHTIISTVSYWLHRSALFFLPTQRR